MKPWESYQPKTGPWSEYQATEVAPDQGYIDTVKGRLSSIVDPETWKQAGQDLANFPPLPRDDAGGYDVGKIMADPQMEGLAKDVAIMSPVTGLAKATRLLDKPAQSASDIAKQQTLKETGEAGYSLPKSNIKATWSTNLMERFGGKQAIEHTARMKNQPVTNAKAAKALGLSDNVPITPEILDGVRAEAGKAYEALKTGTMMKADKQYISDLDKISKKYSGASKDFPELANFGMADNSVAGYVKGLRKENISIDGALEQVKIMRYMGNKNRKSLDPLVQILGKGQKKAADVLDDLIGRSVKGQAGEEAFKNYQAARKLIAKTYTVEDSLVGSSVNAAKLAKDLKKRKPLSGGLKDIAKFGLNHPNVAKIPQGQAPSGGALEPLVYGVTGMAASGGPGVAAAAIPILGKPIARHLSTKIPRKARERMSPDILENALIQKSLIGSGVTYDRANRNNRSR